MFNLLNDHDYNAFRLRCLLTSPTDIDPRMVPVINEFNTIPGVVSIWSCSGHTVEEQGENTPRYQFPYIIFGASQDSEDMFKRYEQWCQSLSPEDWKKYSAKLTTMQLLVSPVMKQFNISRPIYSCWCLKIRGDFGKDKTGQKTMDHFMEIIKALKG